MKRAFLLLTTAITLSGCGATQSPTTSLSLNGTIVENPAHLREQPPFMLIDVEQNKLLGYIESTKVPLSDFIDRQGSIEGKMRYQSSEGVPTIDVSAFTPSKPLSEEDVLLSTLRRESRKAPYNYRWDQEANMLILQRDNSSGSAQVQVTVKDHKYLVSLVKNRTDWHIADIKEEAYSSEENSSSSGSTSQPSPLST